MQSEQLEKKSDDTAVIAGRYVVRDICNKDQFGATYRVYDTVMNRYAGLRQLFALDDPQEPGEAYRQYERRQRFLNVYRKMAETEISSIPVIYTFHPDGMGAYAVYEDISSLTLGDICRQSNVTDYESIKQWMLPVIVSLKLLHDNGVCHGNVTAESIRMTSRTAVLCDATGNTDEKSADIKDFLSVLLYLSKGKKLSEERSPYDGYIDISSSSENDCEKYNNVISIYDIGQLKLPEELDFCIKQAFLTKQGLSADEVLEKIYQCKQVDLGIKKEEPKPPIYLVELAKECNTEIKKLITSLE